MLLSLNQLTVTYIVEHTQAKNFLFILEANFEFYWSFSDSKINQTNKNLLKNSLAQKKV